MLLFYSGHSFPASAPGPASDHGCWAEYTTAVSSVSSTDSASYSGKKCCCYTQGHSFPASGPAPDRGCWAEYATAVSSVSSTDSASHSGKKLCCYTQGTTSQPQPQAQPQTVVVGQSIPQQYPQSPAQTVPPTQVRNVVVILGGTLSQPQAQPQTVVVGQSMPQQYPQSPAQTVPPTQVRNYVVLLGALLPSLSPRPSLRPWLLGWVYHNSILSLQHRQCLLLR